MQMVSAAKFAKAERALKDARAIGPTSLAIINSGGVELDEAAPKQVTVAVSSDRGLCGGIHSGIAKFIKNDERHNNPDLDTKIVVNGDKARGILNRMYSKDIL